MSALPRSPLLLPDLPARPARTPGPRLNAVEWLLLLLGLLAIDCYIWLNTSGTLYQAYEDWAFDETLRGLAPSVPGFAADEIEALFHTGRNQAAPVATREFEQPPLSASRGPLPDMLIGRLRIPRLQINAMVREGAAEPTLRRAVGHIPGTALPGRGGNVALAGHRDTFFRGLRNIRKNDMIDLQTERGAFQYVVESTSIVSPRDVGVLRASNAGTLTLVTCYPFYYVGSAPKRFIVRAVQVDAKRPLQPPRGS